MNRFNVPVDFRGFMFIADARRLIFAENQQTIGAYLREIHIIT